MSATKYVTQPVARRVTRLVTEPSILPAGTPFPYPDAVIDLDFINQRGYWGGAPHALSEMTSWVLGTSTFGPYGLTVGGTFDIRLTLAGTGFTGPAGAIAAVYRTGSAAPGAVEVVASLDNNGVADRVNVLWNTNGNMSVSTTVGGSPQANTGGGGVALLNQRVAIAASFNTNDFAASGNGQVGGTDNLGTLPSLVSLRIGELSNSSSPATQPIGRVILFNAPKTMGELQAISGALKAIGDAWSPLDLGAKMRAWYNADVFGAGAVSGWTPGAGAGPIVAQATAGLQPVAALLNGKMFVGFDGTDDYLRAENTSGLHLPATPSMVWNLVSQDTPGANATMRIVDTYGAVTGQQQRRTQRANQASFSRLQVTNVTATSHADTVNDFQNICATAAIFTATDNAGRINGRKTTPVSTPHGGTMNTGVLRTTFGASNADTPASFWQGKLRHKLYTDLLDDGESEKMEAWLLWDVAAQASLPVDHPYRSVRP